MESLSLMFGIWRSSFRPLRLANLRTYLGGQAISLVGTWLQTTAQSLLVYQLSHGSAAALGVVAVAGALPMLVFSLWVGNFADRFDRRKLLIATQIGEMLLAFILAWLAQSGQAQLWHVYVLACCGGAKWVRAVYLCDCASHRRRQCSEHRISAWRGRRRIVVLHIFCHAIC